MARELVGACRKDRVALVELLGTLVELACNLCGLCCGRLALRVQLGACLGDLPGERCDLRLALRCGLGTTRKLLLARVEMSFPLAQRGRLLVRRHEQPFLLV